METIRSLIRTVEKVADSLLRNEMLGKVSEVQNKLVNTSRKLQEKQAEIDGLREHLAHLGRRAEQGASIVYDPPV